MITHRFSGHLTVADHKGHVPIPFEVPAGTTRISAHFTAEPKRATGALFNNLISLSVFGPAGARGCRHNNPEWDFAIDAHAATPGYTPGPIEAGQWQVVMDCFRVLGPEPIAWTLEVTLADAPLPRPAAPPTPIAPNRGAGWYRGDLHAHTLHSDSRWDFEGLIGFARANALDFVTLTDHNTVSGLAAFERHSDETLLAMGGVELTTHFGHCLALGTRLWHEWRAGSMPGVTMPEVAASVEASGALYVIAHPRSPGDPACTGCRWEFDDMMPGPARAVEVWNGPWSDYNEDGLALFRTWLDAGHRLVATAGSDTHGPGPRNERNGFNTVNADALTEAAIIAAIRAGRNVLSSGPRMIVDAVGTRGERAGPGESLTGKLDGLRLETSQADALEVRVVGAGGRTLRAMPAPSTGTIEINARDVTRAETGNVTPDWLMLELRGADNVLHAVTNPIWLTPA